MAPWRRTTCFVTITLLSLASPPSPFPPLPSLLLIPPATPPFLRQRMIIGLRVFLLIADSLEKKEGDPPMPLNAGLLPSGGPPRVKTKFLSTTLTDETAKKIGIAPFYQP